ncbi:MAG: dihydrodipicolinate reductase, partial [Nitrososphaerota archaeon]
LFSNIKGDIVIHATVSDLKLAYPQIKECIKAGMNVISTCEQLSYPYYRHPELAKKLNNLAKKYDVTILGTGINPGYLMDSLPIMLTALCQEIYKIKVVRMMDAGKRRIAYQKKIGVGLTLEEFKQKIDKKLITGHVGLVESIALIASAIGWKLDEIKEIPPEPIIAEEERTTEYTTVKIGNVAGLKSIAYGIMKNKEVITLEFISHVNVKEEYDEVLIEGIPNIHERIIGGVHGDIGTVSIIINSIPKVLEAPAGLLTMKDLPLPSAWKV